MVKFYKLERGVWVNLSHIRYMTDKVVYVGNDRWVDITSADHEGLVAAFQADNRAYVKGE
jgi:hypothetical protein